jgi:pyruvate dehydrogenase E2 component (dihydrolipoamide acetyltransferase)
MLEFRLPSLGAEMDEGTILEWRIEPGQEVKKGDVVAVVDTSKAAIDVEIWQDGTVLELLVGVGEKVPVGTALALLRDVGETPEHAEEERRDRAARTAVPAQAALPAAAPAVPPPTAAIATGAGARPAVSPAARRRAQELGVDAASLAGTGAQGAVTIRDVELAAAGAAPRDRAVEMRAAIAAAMARSKREIPHYYLAADVPLAAAAQWLGERNAGRPIGERVLMAALLIKAVALALRHYPELNGHFRDGRFVAGEGIHTGVAISLRQGGLVAPALLDADREGIDQLMRRLTDLVARARALTLRSSEMADATVTVTNLGDQGVDVVHGVIYPPQVALAGFGRVTERPWIENGAIVARPVVTASLAADHRASDGHRGALFLAEVGRLLQDPAALDRPEH